MPSVTGLSSPIAAEMVLLATSTSFSTRSGCSKAYFAATPSSLRISTHGSFFNAQCIHESFELIDSTLDTFAGWVVRIGIAEPTDAVEGVNLIFGSQRRHQLGKAGLAGGARPAA